MDSLVDLSTASLARRTSLVAALELAKEFTIGHVLVKAEFERPLGNFKVLGGMAAVEAALGSRESKGSSHQDARLICASDGNHGLAVAFAARRAGVAARIFLPRGVSPARAHRIAHFDAEIEWVDGTYDDAVRAAAACAAAGFGQLVPDTSEHADDPIIRAVMSGYARISIEVLEQCRAQRLPVPTHVFVQAGVGGLAASIAQTLVERMAEPRRIVVVEPESAACVGEALRVGRPLQIAGALVTSAEMLSCGLASAAAVRTLLECGASALTVDEAQLQQAARALTRVTSTPMTESASAGLAGLAKVSGSPQLRARFGLEANSCVLLVATERAPSLQAL